MAVLRAPVGEEEELMSIIDKVKAQAEVGLAKATEAGKAGQAKLDAVQAKHNADGLLRRLGATAYAESQGRSSPEMATTAEQLVAELRQYEAEYGPLAP
jgi:hypothetical protein